MGACGFGFFSPLNHAPFSTSSLWTILPSPYGTFWGSTLCGSRRDVDKAVFEGRGMPLFFQGSCRIMTLCCSGLFTRKNSFKYSIVSQCDGVFRRHYCHQNLGRIHCGSDLKSVAEWVRNAPFLFFPSAHNYWFWRRYLLPDHAIAIHIAWLNSSNTITLKSLILALDFPS